MKLGSGVGSLVEVSEKLEEEYGDQLPALYAERPELDPDSETKANLIDADIEANTGDFSEEEIAEMLESRTPEMQGLLTANKDNG